MIQVRATSRLFICGLAMFLSRITPQQKKKMGQKEAGDMVPSVYQPKLHPFSEFRIGKLLNIHELVA